MPVPPADDLLIAPEPLDLPDLSDLDQCADEPIERPGSVQPHGVLLVVEESTRTLLSASASIAQWLPGAPATPGTALADVLGVVLAGLVDELLADGDLSEPIRWTGPPSGAWAGRLVDVMLHRSDGRLLIEFEATTDASHGRSVSLSATRSAIDRLGRADSVGEALTQLTRAVRRVTGFDRVMVYRFDRDWNGEVIAEARRADLEPLLGLSYPESDIPAQARRLYALNRLRFIVDAKAVASKMIPTVPADGKGELDLSYAPLRSVSPVHLEYLAGMGVRASMSVSMIRNGELWGLVACHHYTGTLQPSHDERAAADLLAQGAVQIVTERQAVEDAARLTRGRERLSRLTAVIERNRERPLEALAEGDLTLIAALSAATGLVLATGRRRVRWGRTVDDRTADAIVQALHHHDGIPVFTDHLASLPGDLGGEDAAGALLLRLGPSEWILWLGEPQDRAVQWAGDPADKTVLIRADGSARIGPRRSFEAQQQIVRGRSAPWISWKVQAVAELGGIVLAANLARDREALSVAEDLHHALLPVALAGVPGLELEVRYVPAPGGRFAGDWWDAFELPDRKLALIVGDVAGHGSAAAATMAQLRTALRAYLIERRPPAETLARLDGLAHLLFPAKLATVVLAVLDLSSGELQISRAGHPHPIMVTEAGARPVEVVSRPPIGVGRQSAAGTWTGRLGDGDLLVLHSDGLYERRDRSLVQGATALGDVASTAYDESLPVVADRLLAAVPGRNDDDVTVLIARVRGVTEGADTHDAR
jgi:chemotaxis family two-component system sensor kinase Cph1